MDNVLRGTVLNPEKIYGKSAYEIAVMNGFQGTEEEWLDSLNGGLVTVDKQLYRSGHAADAAVVGEKFNQTSSELALQKARIDNLAALPEGSTTGDAELIDIRVGDDGVIYDSAGNAVRTQFSRIKQYMSEGVYALPFNISNGFLNYETGEPNPNVGSACYTEEYFETEKISEIEMVYGYKYYLHYYDDNKVWIKPNEVTVTSYRPDKTYKYCRVCFSNANPLTHEEIRTIYKLYFKTKYEYRPNWIPKKTVNFETGAESKSDAYSSTGFLKLPKGLTSNYICIKASTTSNVGCVTFFDENKNFIFGYRGNYIGGKYFEIPTGTKYFRMSCLIENIDSAGAYVFAHNTTNEILNDILKTFTTEGATWEE